MTNTVLTLPTYAFRHPAELDRPQPAPYPVVVVGAGLTGLSTALDLVRRGIAVTVLDDDNTVGVRGLASRGMVWAQRTLDIFDRLGVAERIVSKGVRWNIGRVLCRDVPVTSFTLQEQPDVRHAGFANLQQYYVEQFLVEALQNEPLADLRWLNKVTSLRQLADGVELEVGTPEGSYRTRAQWVVACDGANSHLRACLSLAPQVYDRSEDRWIIIDVIVHNQDWPEERWTWLDAGANGGRAVWRHKMADDTWRLDFQLGSDEDAEAAATPEAMRRRVQALLGTEVAFDIAWSGAWGYRHECLDQLRCGRVIFAGDAAHLVAPFGARGGNGGIQDADNLGWKLALHLQGHAGEALVDSYCRERRHAALDNIRQARRSSRFVFPADHAAVLPWRDAIIALAPTHALAARMINTGRLSAPCVYGESALVRAGHMSAGAALPNVLLSPGGAGAPSGATLHGLLGPWFTALVMADRVPDRRAVQDQHPLLKWVPIAAHCDAAGRQAVARQLGTDADDGSVWLIRPDQHVMSVSKNAQAADAAAWLRQALAASVEESSDHARLPAAA